MKIAVIGAKNIPANKGEIEGYCQEFYPRIAERGHEVDLFIQRESGGQPWFSVSYYQNVRAISLPALPRKHLSFFLNAALGTIWASLGKYDLIHIQGTKAAWFAWFPQLFSGSKIVVTSHQLDLEPQKFNRVFRWLLPWIERTAVKNADETIVTSKPLKEYFQDKYNISPRYIPNAPISHQKTESESDRLKSLELETKGYILCLEPLTPEHNADLLLEAFQKLQPLGWKLVLVGGIGNSDSSLKYAIELLNLAKQNHNIIFTNEVRGHYLAQLIENAGLLVAPTAGKDLGVSSNVLKAMSEGIPVLASDNPVYRELIGTDRGLLFESGKLDSLCQKLAYALTEPTSLTVMAQKARTHIAIEHNWDRITYGNLSLYLKVTARLDSSAIQPNL